VGKKTRMMVTAIILAFGLMVAVPAIANAYAVYPTTMIGERNIVAHINYERHVRGVAPLGYSLCARLYAGQWNTHLASTGLWYHSNVTQLLTRCRTTFVGEVLARGNMSSAQVVAAWMASPPHRVILLDPRYRSLGIAAGGSSQGTSTYTGEFVR
jgi:uncharacterized protein YkwD